MEYLRRTLNERRLRPEIDISKATKLQKLIHVLKTRGGTEKQERDWEMAKFHIRNRRIPSFLMYEAILIRRQTNATDTLVVWEKSPYTSDVFCSLRWDLQMYGNKDLRSTMTPAEREQVKTWWKSKGVGVEGHKRGEIHVRFTGENDRWERLREYPPFQEYLVSNNLKITDMSFGGQIKKAMEYARHSPDYRYGEGDQSIKKNMKPNRLRDWEFPRPRWG